MSRGSPPSNGDTVSASRPELDFRELQASDVLLVQGTAQEIKRLKVSGELLVLDGTMHLPSTRKAPLALTIMALPVERSFRRGRTWYKQFYNPRSMAAEFQDKVNGKHYLSNLPEPGELAQELEAAIAAG